MTNQESIVDRVVKLLEKAESTERQFPEEAEAFRTKAEELIVRHAIDQAMLQARAGARTDEVIIKRFTFGGQWGSANAHLCYCVANGFGFKTIQTKFGGDPAGMIHPGWIGFKSEIEAAELLLTSLLIQSANALSRYTAELKERYSYANTKQLYKHRRSFIYGFGDAVCVRLQEIHRQVTDEVDTETSGGASLVLLSRQELVDTRFAEMFPKLGKARSSSAQHSGHGLSAGAAAGAKADINQERIGSRKAIGS